MGRQNRINVLTDLSQSRMSTECQTASKSKAFVAQEPPQAPIFFIWRDT